MAAFLDGCRFNPATGGVADWTYASAVPGYQSPASANIVNGRLYKYRAESADLSQWEFGEGAYNIATGVLARITVLYNSSGTTAKINFSTTPQVAIVALKEDLISVEEANSFSSTQQAQARSNIGAQALIAFGTVALAGNVAITPSSTWVDVLSLTLAAGSYMVFAKVTIKDTSSGAPLISRLVDGTATTVYDTSNYVNSAGANLRVQNVMVCAITLATAATIKLQSQDAGGSAGLVTANDSGEPVARDTTLTWLKIG